MEVPSLLPALQILRRFRDSDAQPRYRGFSVAARFADTSRVDLEFQGVTFWWMGSLS